MNLSDELTQTFFDCPTPIIEIAPRLSDFANNAEPGATNRLVTVYLQSLTLKAAPEIDTAVLIQDIAGPREILPLTSPPTGTAPPFTYIPLSLQQLQDKFIKITIPDTVNLVTPQPVIWYGMIDTITQDGLVTGQMQITCVGLLRLAELHTIDNAICQKFDGVGTLGIGVGLPFNQDRDDAYGVVGNRGDVRQAPDNNYVFAWENRSNVVWTSHEAIRYLLAECVPTNYDGNQIPRWGLHPTTLTVKPSDWYTPQVDTDRRTLKEVLDDLLPRSRGLGYYCEYDPASDKILLRVFTFVASPLEVGKDADNQPLFLPANFDQVEVDLTRSIWYVEGRIVESSQGRWDSVVGLGEHLTTTCTLNFGADDKQFVPDWSAAEEAAYKAASSTTDVQVNSRFRSEDRYGNVYCRFRISDEFSGRTKYNPGDGLNQYFIAPPLDSDYNVKQPYDPTSSVDGLPMRVRGLKILHDLPLRDRVDYFDDKIDKGYVRMQLATLNSNRESTPEYLSPIIFVNPGGSYWYLLDQLSTATEQETQVNLRRHWACHVTIPRTLPGLELKVTSGRQTLIASSAFLTPPPDGVYDKELDPERNNGLNYTAFQATVCLQLEHRLQVRKQIANAATTDRPERVLELTIRNARRDYVVPGTVVGIEGGSLKISKTGGFVRDNIGRVVSLVSATAEWYGREKRALVFAYKQARKLVDIGDLITEAAGAKWVAAQNGTNAANLSQNSQSDWQPQALTVEATYSGNVPQPRVVVNTPITSITYTLGQGNSGGMTRIETGFAEIEFV